MTYEQVLEQRRIETVDRTDRIDDRVLRRELEHHRNVAELEVGVDEDDRPIGPSGQHDGEVGGDH